MNKDTTNDYYYNVFIVGELLRGFGYEEETDVIFELSQSIYHDFLRSDYDRKYKSEYDCLVEFVSDIYGDQYILDLNEQSIINEDWAEFKEERGITGFADADLAYEYAEEAVISPYIKQREAQCNAIVGYIGLLEETE